jgi:hypothetical protein
VSNRRYFDIVAQNTNAWKQSKEAAGVREPVIVKVGRHMKKKKKQKLKSESPHIWELCYRYKTSKYVWMNLPRG